MCGLFSISSSNKIDFDMGEIVNSLSHRGPDSNDFFMSDDQSTFLAHVRLSILDISENGRQPMFDSSNRYVIVYNGEVYNFQELKIYIEKKYSFFKWTSHSDTEVIIEGFAREGHSFLEKMNGFFSIVIYDLLDNLTYVLRDPLGIKPLFVIESNGLTAFGSELKALLKIPGINLSLRLQSFYEQLSFMFIPEPFTYFNQIRKLEPGIFFTYQNGVLLRQVSLFDNVLQKSKAFKTKGENEIIEIFNETFFAAVKRQLVSDVPVSIMLSGGLDSSAVAKVAVDAGANIKDAYTISVSNDDNRLDMQENDFFHAKKMADILGLNLVEIRANKNFLTLLPVLSRFLEDGISDPAAINTYLITQTAKENDIKVMLTGQGADEYLAGYRRHQANAVLNFAPPFAKSIFGLIAKFLPSQVDGRFNSAYRRGKRIVELLSMDKQKQMLSLYSWAEYETIYSLFKQPSSLHSEHQVLANFQNVRHNSDSGETLLDYDQLYDLRSLNLVYSDRLSMANGVEARVPFLDFDLVEVMNAIPYSLKLKNNTTKYIFKKAMESKLPMEIIYREKSGFGLPLRAWLREDIALIKEYLSPKVINKLGVFNSEKIALILQEQYSGVVDHSNLIFSLLCIHVLFSNDDYSKFSF